MELNPNSVVWVSQQSERYHDHYWVHVKGIYLNMIESVSKAMYIPEGASGEFIEARIDEAKPFLIADLKRRIQIIINSVSG